MSLLIQRIAQLMCRLIKEIKNPHICNSLGYDLSKIFLKALNLPYKPAFGSRFAL